MEEVMEIQGTSIIQGGGKSGKKIQYVHMDVEKDGQKEHNMQIEVYRLVNELFDP